MILCVDIKYIELFKDNLIIIVIQLSKITNFSKNSGYRLQVNIKLRLLSMILVYAKNSHSSLWRKVVIFVNN